MLGRQTANIANDANTFSTSGADALSAATKAGQMYSSGLNKIVANESLNRDRLIDNYRDSATAMASERARKFQYDWAKAEDSRTRRDNLIGAGLQTMAGAGQVLLRIRNGRQENECLHGNV